MVLCRESVVFTDMLDGLMCVYTYICICAVVSYGRYQCLLYSNCKQVSLG